MAATEAWENGLVMEVLKTGNFMDQVNSRVKSLAAMANKVLVANKVYKQLKTRARNCDLIFPFATCFHLRSFETKGLAVATLLLLLLK